MNHRRVGTRSWRSLLGLALLAAACAPGPPRSRGPTFGAEREPFLSARAAAAIDRREDPVHRLILLGDGGDPLPDDPTLAALGRWGDARPERTTVLFLGDNVYPAGLRDDDRERGEAILRQQLEATRAHRIFLPGNHDWGFVAGSSPASAVATLLDQQRFLDGWADEGVEFLPRDGCPGPVPRNLVAPGGELRGGLTVLIVDFHWWLLPEAQRPRCPGARDTEEFLETLRRALATRVDAGETVVVAAHHPLRSGGPHGGLTRGFWLDFGAGLYYRLRGPLQDLWEPGYAGMIRVVSEALAEAPPLAFVAGHDHSLQVLEGGDAARLLIVSGAASRPRLTGVAAIEGTLFAHSHAGFVVLDFFAGGSASDAVLLRVVETGKAQPVWTLGLDLEAVEQPRPAAAAEDRRVDSAFCRTPRAARATHSRHGRCTWSHGGAAAAARFGASATALARSKENRMRKLATMLGGAAALLFAATTGQAAEITGTVLSSDPAGGTVLVRTHDGQTLTIRTDETTRVMKGDTEVESTTLLRGAPVQVVTTEVPTGEAATTVSPVATRIVLIPSAPAVMQDDEDTDVDIDTDDDDDPDVDIDTEE